MDKEITIPLPGGVGMDFILVEPGHFIMGSEAEEADSDEAPEHIVEITQPFYIGKYPVTQAQWQAVMGDNPALFEGKDNPVEQVSWQDIVEGNQDDIGRPSFLSQLNKHLSTASPSMKEPHEAFLPTEAQWEYAAKGGPRFLFKELRGKKAAQLYPVYAGGDQLERCGWFDGNSNFKTHPVGLLQPNALGLYDVSGNVYEWCQDWFDGKVYQQREGIEVTQDPVSLTGGPYRVLRGGSWIRSARSCRLSDRDGDHPGYRFNDCGFRLVLAPVRASE